MLNPLCKLAPAVLAAFTSLAFIDSANDTPATTSFHFPEAQYGRGSLRYINGVAVLLVSGTPEEMGEQMGVLAIKPAVGAIGLLEQFLKEQGVSRLKSVFVKVGDKLLARAPDAYRRELDAAAKAGGVDRDLLVISNTFHDLRRLFGCAALMAAPERSATGGALMGRNLDYQLVRGMQAYSLVIVFKAEGKKPFAVVSFPGATLLGCAMTAMNADGLVIGTNEVYGAADGSPLVDVKNTPTALLARRILETCSTIAEAEKILQADKPASRSIVVVCDRHGGAAIEATPKTVKLRRGSEEGLCWATNHFLTQGLCVTNTCLRSQALSRAASLEKVSVADTARLLGDAHQGALTAHAMVFEPASLRIHIAFGDGDRPATAFPFKRVELEGLLKQTSD